MLIRDTRRDSYEIAKGVGCGGLAVMSQPVDEAAAATGISQVVSTPGPSPYRLT